MHGRVTTPSDVIWIEMSTKQAINNVARWSNAENLYLDRYSRIGLTRYGSMARRAMLRILLLLWHGNG